MPTKADIKAEIRGLRELAAKSDQIVRDLHGPPMLQAMRDATLIVTRQARINAPVDTGRLRASITPEVLTRGRDLVGIVGSNVEYAPYQEFGTVYMPGRFYLTRALQDNADKIYRLLGRVIGRIVEE